MNSIANKKFHISRSLQIRRFFLLADLELFSVLKGQDKSMENNTYLICLHFLSMFHKKIVTSLKLPQHVLSEK